MQSSVATNMTQPINPYLKEAIELNESGYLYMKRQKLPLTPEEWQLVIDTNNKLKYEWAPNTETGEAISNYECFRIKMSYLPEIHNKTIWDTFNTSKMYELYKGLFQINDPYFDRFQCHRIHPGGFHGIHTDDDKYEEYLFTMLVYPESGYEGGALNIYPSKDQPPIVINPEPMSILFIKSKTLHSVEKIESGIRKSMAGFFSNGKCFPKIVKS